MKKNIKAILLILFISLFTEVFIFNIKTITSINFKQISVKSKIILGSDIIDSNGIYVVKNTKNAYIEIKNINKNIHNLFIDLDFIKNSGKYLEYDIYASDSGSKLYYKLPSRYLYNNIERSKYVDLNLSGKVNKLKIVFKNNNFKFKINNIAINKSRPIDISWTRLIITFTLLLVIYYIRPNSELYKYTFNLKSKKQKIIIVLYLIIQFIFFFYIVNINKYVKNPGLYSQHYQYQDLAHSLSRGKLYLEIPVDKNLKNMKNPYDTKYRAKLSNEKGLSFYPDRAFYEGKYYVYFGVVPVITAYLPYYLLTGKDLNTYILIFVVTCITTVAIMLFLKELICKFFKKTSFILYLIMTVLLVNCSGLICITSYATFYNLPVLYSLMFTYLGLYLFMSAFGAKKTNSIKIFFGALCMALVAGCRPQFLVGTFLLIPLLWDEILKKRTLFSKNSIKNTLCLIIPYVLIAVLIMIYNKLRFSSPFDFGANYNLTTNDMTKRGINMHRTGLGLFYYLFVPPNIKATFPFLISNSIYTNYMGITITEGMESGLLSSNIILIFGLLFYKFKKIIPKKLFIMCLVSIILGFCVIFCDTQMSGILYRYISDFAWLFFIPTIIVILSIFNCNWQLKLKNSIMEIVIVLIFYSLLYQALYALGDYFMYDMINTNTEFYFKWYYLIQWWL